MQATLMDALGWALIHSLWQCAAIGILFAAANLALRRASANLRYVLSYSALLAMPVAAVATFLALFQHHELSAALPVSMPVLSRIASAPISSSPIAPSSSPIPYLTMVVWFWLAGVVAMSAWSAAGWFVAQRLKRRSNRLLPEIWQTRLAALAGQLGIRRGIKLCESTLAQVPAVIGWIRPVILIPAGALINLSAQELEAVLAHELAHIRRFDYVANLLQSAIEALMFYHPAMWWIGETHPRRARKLLRRSRHRRLWRPRGVRARPHCSRGNARCLSTVRHGRHWRTAWSAACAVCSGKMIRDAVRCRCGSRSPPC